MGLFSSACSFVSSCVSSVGSAISSAVSSIGSAVSSFATKVAPAIGSILGKIPTVLATVSPWVSALSWGLSLFRPNEKVEDIGDRALQAASEKDIKPEKFPDFEQYMEALRNFDLNPAVSKKTSQATKVVAGMAVATLGMEEKFNLSRGSLDGMWLLPVANPDYFTPERVKSLLEQGKLVGDVGAYLEKRMSGEEASAFRKNYEVTPEGKPMNDTELGQLYNAMDKARAEWAALDQKIKAND